MTETKTMRDAKALVADAYAAFNRRDSDGALALMHDGVSWPKASEGGRVVGKDAIRAYWTRQWATFDPRVEPVQMTEAPEGRVEVRVHQVVRSLDGDLLADDEVEHVFAVVDGLIDRMDLKEAGANDGPSAAFSHRQA